MRQCPKPADRLLRNFSPGHGRPVDTCPDARSREPSGTSDKECLRGPPAPPSRSIRKLRSISAKRQSPAQMSDHHPRSGPAIRGGFPRFVPLRRPAKAGHATPRKHFQNGPPRSFRRRVPTRHGSNFSPARTHAHHPACARTAWATSFEQPSAPRFGIHSTPRVPGLLFPGLDAPPASCPPRWRFRAGCLPEPVSKSHGHPHA
jgi:hypothetical protein